MSEGTKAAIALLSAFIIIGAPFWIAIWFGTRWIHFGGPNRKPDWWR